MRPPLSPAGGISPVVQATPAIVPALAAVVAGMRFQFGPGVTLAIVAAVVLLPVWWSALSAYRFVRPLLVVGVLAVGWGALLTVLDPVRETEVARLLRETFPVLGMIASVGLLLWARSCIGPSWTVVAYAVGGFAQFAITGGNPANLWKYTLSIPVALLLLGLASRMGRGWELVVLAAVAGMSAVSDARSSLAILLIAATLVIVQLPPSRSRRARPWRALVTLVALGLAVTAVVQALLVDGALGEAAALRTQQQASSGSFVLGGRPEAGAAVALVLRQPWGYGSGTAPTLADVLAAKSGMATLGYDPNNGYVDRFMFGTGFEVHSVLGDFWVRFGPLGALFSIGLLALAVYSVATRVSLRTASGALAFLVALGVWDTFFSPLLTSYNTLALLLALAVLPRRQSGTTERRGAPGRPDRVLQRRPAPRHG